MFADTGIVMWPIVALLGIIGNFAITIPAGGLIPAMLYADEDLVIKKMAKYNIIILVGLIALSTIIALMCM